LEITINLGFRDHPHRLHAKDPWKGPMSSLEPGQNLGFGLTSAAQSPSLAPSGVLLLLGLVEPSYWKTTPPPSLPSCCFPLQPKVQVRVKEFWVWRGTERGYGFQGLASIDTKSPATSNAIIAGLQVPPSLSVFGWGLRVVDQRFWGLGFQSEHSATPSPVTILAVTACFARPRFSPLSNKARVRVLCVGRANREWARLFVL